ncbi:hypothetical protein Zm00014a_036948 [Zea mays]|uniref:Uncharacterized protein n=1 Tax=Zea mays TaxID=4577 RepID=A0A317Y4Y8_MAIZE|nr:hypothetical protein Zm00014a_036948 [Zea mays]
MVSSTKDSTPPFFFKCRICLGCTDPGKFTAELSLLVFPALRNSAAMYSVSTWLQNPFKRTSQAGSDQCPPPSPHYSCMAACRCNCLEGKRRSSSPNKKLRVFVTFFSKTKTLKKDITNGKNRTGSRDHEAKHQHLKNLVVMKK